MRSFYSQPLAAAALLAGSLAGTPALADTGIVSFTVGSSIAAFSSDETIGWIFALPAGPGVTVTQLGWWDQTPASPLAASHQVGLWSVSGTLIASATVLPGDPLTGGFRYAALSSPVTLGGGTVYMIGGRDTLADGDNYSTANSALVMGAGINFGGATRSNVGVGFAFPVNTTGDPGGHFGPNFIYAAVPEASTQLMMLMGLGAVGGLAARRRARAAAGA